VQTQLAIPAQGPTSQEPRNSIAEPIVTPADPQFDVEKRTSLRQDVAEESETADTSKILSNGNICAEPMAMDVGSESEGNSERDEEEEEWESFPLTPPRVRDPW
jgi:hypothetical protein